MRGFAYSSASFREGKTRLQAELGGDRELRVLKGSVEDKRFREIGEGYIFGG